MAKSPVTVSSALLTTEELVFEESPALEVPLEEEVPAAEEEEEELDPAEVVVDEVASEVLEEDTKVEMEQDARNAQDNRTRNDALWVNFITKSSFVRLYHPRHI